MTVGKKIRTLRKQKGLTQKALGELSGIAEPTIRKYELEKLNPKFETLQKIAKALDTDISYFLQIENDDMLKKVVEKLPSATIEETDETISISLVNMKSNLSKEEMDSRMLRHNIVTKFDTLNHTGQLKAYDYVSDLAEQPKYSKKDDK